jgi:hypothetical protein
MSIGEDVRAAMNEVGGKGEAPTDGAIPAPVGVPEGAALGVPIDRPDPTVVRTRDESGRFAKGGDKPQETSTPVPPKQDTPTAPAPQKRAAPQSWRPTIREHWEKLPPEVQEEVYRVEGTTGRLLQTSAQYRKQAEAFERALAPYKPYIQGEPAQWAEGIISRAVQLRTAPAQQRAALAAQILRESEVDIRLLDEALGAPPPAQQRHAPQDDGLRSELEELRAQLREIQTAPMAREVEDFTKSAEFLDEPMPDGRHTVREMVAVQLKAAGMQGVALSLQDAYDTVVARHPTIQEALKQRAEAKAHAERSASTAKALAASSSVRTEHVVTPPPDDRGGSVHDDVRATVAMLRKGR